MTYAFVLLAMFILYFPIRSRTIAVGSVIVSTAPAAWTGTLRVIYTQNIVLRLAERVWCTKSLSSILNVYFRLSGFQSSLLPICYRDDPNECLHCTKIHYERYPTSFALIFLMLSSQNMRMELSQYTTQFLAPYTYTRGQTVLQPFQGANKMRTET